MNSRRSSHQVVTDNKKVLKIIFKQQKKYVNNDA